MVQVLNQDETPLLYSLVFGEGVVNDATSVVLFNAIQSFDLSHISTSAALQFIGKFFYLFITSTMLGVVVSPLLSHMSTQWVNILLFDVFIFCLVQAGLLSAYIIKKLYFGRFVSSGSRLIFLISMLNIKAAYAMQGWKSLTTLLFLFNDFNYSSSFKDTSR